MIAVRLTPDVRMMAVASPNYLARHGEPKTPADLHHHACINWRFPVAETFIGGRLKKKKKKLELNVEGPLISNFQDVVVEGALQGLGILYAYHDDLVLDALEQGRLKRGRVDAYFCSTKQGYLGRKRGISRSWHWLTRTTRCFQRRLGAHSPYRRGQ